MSEKYLVGEESCPGCKMAKAYLKEELEKGEFKFVEIDSELGQEIDSIFNFREIPQCVYRDGNGNFKKCDLEAEIEASLKRKGKG